MILERIALVSSHFLLNEVTKHETEQRMIGSFFDEILRGEFQDEEEILRRGSFIHLDLSESFRIAMIKYRTRRITCKKDLFFMKKWLKKLLVIFKMKKGNILIGHRTKSVIVLIPNSIIGKEGIDQDLENFLRFLSEKFPEDCFFCRY